MCVCVCVCVCVCACACACACVCVRVHACMHLTCVRCWLSEELCTHAHRMIDQKHKVLCTALPLCPPPGEGGTETPPGAGPCCAEEDLPSDTEETLWASLLHEEAHNEGKGTTTVEGWRAELVWIPFNPHCHPSLSSLTVTPHCHPSLSSLTVIPHCHPSLSPLTVTPHCHHHLIICTYLLLPIVHTPHHHPSHFTLTGGPHQVWCDVRGCHRHP